MFRLDRLRPAHSRLFHPSVAAHPPGAAPGRPQGERVITFESLLGTVSVTVLIDTQLLCAAGAAIWALGGYLALSAIPLFLLAAAIGLPALWGCVVVARLAFEAETAAENN